MHDDPETVPLGRYPPPEPGTAVDLPAPSWLTEYRTQLGPEQPTRTDLVLALSPAELAIGGRLDLAHQRLQLDKAMNYAKARAGQERDKVTRRAAVIAAAPPGAPWSDLELGVRHAPAALAGKRVRCRLCRKSHVCAGADYWDGATASDGLCFGCVLADTRTDLGTDPEQLAITPTAVVPPARGKRGAKGGSHRGTRTAAD